MKFARRLLRCAAFVAAALVGTALRGSADPTLGVPVVPTAAAGPPVEIDECKLLYAGNWLAGESAGVEMKFTNDSSLVADIVSVRVTATGGESAVIRDVGTFSPGVEITHHYREGDGHMMLAPIFTHPHLDCAVTGVHFANGLIWQPATAPAAGPAHGALVSGPDSLSFDGLGTQYDQFVSVNASSRTGALTQSGTCAGVVRVSTIASGWRGAALRVSPVAAGNCVLTIGDELRRLVSIPVSVVAKESPAAPPHR